MITDEQKDTFDAHGYFVLEDVLDAAALSECQTEIRRLHEHYLEFETREAPELQCFQIEPFSQRQKENGMPVLRKIEQTDRFSDVFRRLAEHRKLVAALRKLLGPDILLYRSTLMLKPSHHGSAHGFHQDSAYWPMDPPVSITLSIALTEATPENGCFKVIPGSHQWDLQEWGEIWRDKGDGMTDRTDVDLSGQIEVPMRAGSALFLHSKLVHGSGPNMSTNPRNTALYVYFPTTVNYKPLHAEDPKSLTFRVICGAGGRQKVTMMAV